MTWRQFLFVATLAACSFAYVGCHSVTVTAPSTHQTPDAQPVEHRMGVATLTPVTTFNNRSGAVLPQSGDYSAFFDALGAAAAELSAFTGNGNITQLGAVASGSFPTGLLTGVLGTAHLGSGTASSSTFLRGDQTWAAPTPTNVGLGNVVNLQQAPALVPVTTRTAAVNPAVVSTFYPFDTTSNAIPVTLPTAPATGSVIGGKLITQGSTNAVTFTAGGSDVINVTGTTSLSLTAKNSAVTLQYASAAATGLGYGVWYVFDEHSLTELNGLYYVQATSRTANTFLAAPDGSGGAATFRAIVMGDVNPIVNVNNGLAGLNSSGDFPASIVILNGTAASLASFVPALGQPVLVTDTKKLVFGDGSTAVASLATYATAGTVLGGGGLPTVSTLGSGGGTGGTNPTIVGTGAAFAVTWTEGASPVTNGTLFTITFATPFTNTPIFAVSSSFPGAAQQLTPNAKIPLITAVSTTGLTFTSGITVLSAGQQYTFNFVTTSQ